MSFLELFGFINREELNSIIDKEHKKFIKSLRSRNRKISKIDKRIRRIKDLTDEQLIKEVSNIPTLKQNRDIFKVSFYKELELELDRRLKCAKLLRRDKE